MSKRIVRTLIVIGLLLSIVGLGGLVGLSSAQTPPPPTTTTTAAFQKPPISATNQGVTLTLTSVQADESGTNLNVTVANNSNVDVTFAASLTQLVVGTTQFNEPVDWDFEAFGTDLHPGVVKSGVIKFPALPAGSTQFKAYFTFFIGPSIGLWEPVFSVQI